MRNAMTRNVKGSDDINLHDRFPLVGVGGFDGCRLPRYAGVVHQHIEPAQSFNGFSNHPFNLVAL